MEIIFQEGEGMKKRYLLTIAAALLGTVVSASTAFAGQWVQEGTVWKYRNDDGQFSAGCWQWIDGNQDGIAECYCFDANGIMYANTKAEGFDVNADGAWVEGGVVQTKAVNGPAGQSGSSGSSSGSSSNAAQGWYQAGGLWRYRAGNSDVANAWRKISGATYYFDDMGNMVTGFQDIDGGMFYFDNSGALKKKTFIMDGVAYIIPDNDGLITDEIDEYEYRQSQRSGSSGGSSSGSSSSGGSSSGGSIIITVGGSGSSSGNSSSGGSSSGGSSSSGNTNTAVDVSAYAYEVFELVNQQREANGKEPLQWSDDIAECAQTRAVEQAESFSHTRPNGTSCFSIFGENGIDYYSAGENIAMGQRSPSSVMNSWMNSSGHRANILKDSYKEIGVGCYSAGGTLYWVQMFIAR